MGFKCGIVGLPNVGKSTIFNALTNAGAAAANYPFCTIDPNVGRVAIPEPRLKELEGFIATQKVVPAAMEFVDIAGLVKGASQGAGRGNQFLSHIRETDAIAHVVRCFENDDVTHVDGSVEPIRDIETIDSELIIADLNTAENAVKRLSKLTKSGDKKILTQLEFMKALEAHLQELQTARTFAYDGFDLANPDPDSDLFIAFRDLHLITAKRVLYVCNVDEDLAGGQVDNTMTSAVKERAKAEQAEVVIICGKIEEELGQLDQESRLEMMTELGMQEAGLDRLIRAGFHLLGLQTYFTAGEKEIRAWTIRQGDTAPVAAGKIHSDFQRGFICAEVYTLDDIKTTGSKSSLKEAGRIRTEGRDYVVVDGDVMEFRFNV